MKGRKPMMCVTVLQSQPSVSIPTLTMQRTSRPGGWRGRSSFFAKSSNPSGRMDALGNPRAMTILPTVSRVKRIQRDSSDLAASESVS